MRENHRNLQVRVSVFFVVESGCGNLFSVLLQSFSAYQLNIAYRCSLGIRCDSGTTVHSCIGSPGILSQKTFCVDWVYHALTGECSLFIRTLG